MNNSLIVDDDINTNKKVNYDINLKIEILCRDSENQLGQFFCKNDKDFELENQQRSIYEGKFNFELLSLPYKKLNKKNKKKHTKDTKFIIFWTD